MNTYEDTIYSFNWYPNELPKTGDVVIVRKLCIDEMGAWVELLENYALMKWMQKRIYSFIMRRKTP